MKRVLALDFDGVLCDSAKELALSAWRAGAAIWPHWDKQKAPDPIVQGFRKVRPVLETGYQAIPVLGLLQEGVDEESILQKADQLIAQEMTKIGRDKSALKDLLAAARQGWIDADLENWLGAHEFYPGTVEAVKKELAEGTDVYIITTKQEAFTRRLLHAQGLQVPQERIYSLERIEKLAGKLGVLESLIRDYPDAPIAFVEDRLETLAAVLARPDLKRIGAFLADWGFNTREARDRAMQMSGIEVIGLADFPPSCQKRT